ncbi:hypothetical protein T440DRAFT_447561 [Plenodomus tracheiphilus IPT5]|uniref:Ubiquitin-like domain-containing protein n=1 Tax=Plenodomus tracheiphilus IPT5 TaxID=1408161 RepID=A0A6A7B911_9PLEO|nr:hypothetical protein T440DRAFT_447561 [Plenodomus tracheiphilus IPT5]
MPVAPVKFKDALGRKFSFPWGLCMTWKVWGLEELIKQAFRHIDIIGRHVHEGHYDLEGPDGKTILPQAWDRVIQPDWAITMHMWPMPEPPPQPASLPPTPLNYIYHPSPSKQTTATILLDSSSTPPRTPSPTPVNSASEEISMSGSKMHAPRGARPEFRRAFKPELYESETKKKESKHQRYGYPRVTEINDEGWESDAEANMKTVTKDRVTKVTE